MAAGVAAVQQPRLRLLLAAALFGAAVAVAQVVITTQPQR